MDKSPAPKPGYSLPRLLLVLFLFLWVVLILVLFQLNHKPLAGAVLARCVESFIILAGVAWTVWIAEGVGRPWIRNGGWNILEQTALAGALGLGVLGVLTLGLAALGWISPTAIGLTWLLLTIVFCRESARWFTALARTIADRGPREPGFSRFCRVFVVATLLLSLGVALSPPVAWDALVYHLRIPQQMMTIQSLRLPGDSFFREMPSLSEMIFTGPLALTGRLESAAVAGWCIGLLTLVGLVGTARRMGIRHPLLAPAVLLAGDTLARSMGWAYVDWTTALFGYAAICLFSAHENKVRWIVLAGVFSGLAFDTKYTAGVLLVVLAASLFPGRQWKRGLRGLVFLLAGFGIAFLPWLLRNLILWGNPLPPLLDASQAGMLRLHFFSGQPLANAGLIAPIIPFLQSTIGRYEAAPFGATIGPLLLLFLPGVFIKRRQPDGGPPFPLGLFALCALAFWAVSGLGVLVSESFAQPRLFMVLFPALALLAAYGFDGFAQLRLGQVRFWVIAGALAVVTMAAQWTGYAVAWVQAEVPAYLTGAVDRTQYLETNLGWYARAMDGVSALPPGSRVQMLWEPRGLYCGEACLEDATIDRWYLAMRVQGSFRKVLADWRDAGFTHVLISNEGADFEKALRPGYSPADWEELERLRSALIPESAYGGFYTLYRIAPED